MKTAEQRMKELQKLMEDVYKRQVLALSLVGCVFLLAIAALFSPHASASHLAPAFTTDATGKYSFCLLYTSRCV